MPTRGSDLRISHSAVKGMPMMQFMMSQNNKLKVKTLDGSVLRPLSKMVTIKFMTMTPVTMNPVTMTPMTMTPMTMTPRIESVVMMITIATTGSVDTCSDAIFSLIKSVMIDSSK